MVLFLLGSSSWAFAADVPSSKIQFVELAGRLVEGGVECPLFEADNGDKYTLVGDLKGFRIGNRVKLTGNFVEISHCMQGKTISVETIEMNDPQ